MNVRFSLIMMDSRVFSSVAEKVYVGQKTNLHEKDKISCLTSLPVNGIELTLSKFRFKRFININQNFSCVF